MWSPERMKVNLERSLPMESRMSDMGRASWACLEKRLILRNGTAEHKRGGERKGGGKRQSIWRRDGGSEPRLLHDYDHNINAMRWVQYCKKLAGSQRILDLDGEN